MLWHAWGVMYLKSSFIITLNSLTFIYDYTSIDYDVCIPF